MPRNRSRATLLFAALLAQLATRGDPATADDGPARVIVKFKANALLVGATALSPTSATTARAATLSARLGLRVRAGATVSDLAQVVFASGVTSAELAQRLAQESDVEYAVPDERRRIVGAPNDPLYAPGVPESGPAVGQWYLRAPSGDLPSSINIEAAWAVTTGSPDVTVAVVDTGVRYEHPDLLGVAAGGNLLPGYDMTSDPDAANDGDGRDAEPSDPGDWVTREELSQPGGPFFRCATSPGDSASDQLESRRRWSVFGRVSAGGRRDRSRRHASRCSRRQFLGACRGRAGQLQRRRRRGWAAPRGYQGGFLVAGPRNRDQRPWRQLRQYRDGIRLPLSDPDDHRFGCYGACQPGVYRQLQHLCRNELRDTSRGPSTNRSAIAQAPPVERGRSTPRPS